jgi:hypothetical protein
MQVLLLALDAALYPTLLAAVVILLSQPRRLPLLATYVCGGLTISIAAGLAVIFVLEGSGALDNSRSGLSWTADRRRAARRGRPADRAAVEKEPWSQRLLARGSVPIVFIAALALNLPGAAYLIALKDIAAANHSTAVDIVLVVAFNLIMFLLAEIPLLGLIFAPDTTNRRVERVNGWFSANGRRIAVVLCTALGVYLIARGIVHS